ncbi:MAG: protoporphyrinogen/coproporphyrinogen oxidase [Acidobacteriota bacterium]
MTQPHVVILGAGPAGLGAAFQLTRRGLAQVTVLEANGRVGGNAGSFELAGIPVDYGSHRLHPACDPEVLKDIQTLLSGDLLDRPRHGRIRLRGRWIHFPLKPIDLALKLPPGFALGTAIDMARKPFRSQPLAQSEATFATVLEAGLGSTICRDFYFPYARKVWGLEPGELSATQARRRVSANSPGKMAVKILSAVPGLKPKGSGRFFYPRGGFGQISSAFYDAAAANGANFLMDARVHQVEMEETGSHVVHFEKNEQNLSIRANHVWSTIPITILARALKPAPPKDCLRAAESIRYRAMILIYLMVEQNRFSEYDAHYFPEQDIPITRLSEPKNYSGEAGPRNLTVLCAELPCMPGDPEWCLTDEDLGRLVCQSLDRAGIPVQAPVRQVVTRRLRQAYPIYQRGYETYFDQLDDWISQVEGLITFGRQGLFAHDNTHHALFMAYSAVACLDREGCFDRARWQEFRRVFEKHVVED